MDENSYNGNDASPANGQPNRGEEAFWDEKSLMEMFNRTTTLMRRYLHIRMHNHNHQGDPHRGQGRILSILKIKPDISQKDLGFLLDMRSQSLGELLMKLERSGYISRTPSEEDRRVMNIHLTDLGMAAAEQAEQRQAGTERLFDCLDGQEQSQLNDYLKRLILHLDKEINAAGGAYGGYNDDSPWKDFCQSKEDLRRHSREMRDQFREQTRSLRRELREHGCRLRDELRRDPRLCGFYWGAQDSWGEGGPFRYNDGDCRGDGRGGPGNGNGPRPE